jgi:hypothetical protein
MKLPEYQTVRENVSLGVATPLEIFIYDNEPFEDRDAKLWREQLEAAVRSLAQVEGCACQPVDDTMPLPLDAEPE